MSNISNRSIITTTTTTTTTTRSSNSSGSTTQACAACKYQRRKCAPDCILAPYFPHDRQRQFLNAHKLFGVSNITKIIKYLDPPLKDQAMRTIMFQSDMRANDPVGGCYKYIQDLQAQIEYHKAELDLVLQQLAIFRAQQQQQPQLYGGGDQVLNNNNNSGDSLGFYNYHYLQQQLPPVQQEQDQYLMVQHEGGSSNNHNNNESNGSNTPLQQHINTWAMQNSVSLSSLSLHGQSSNASDEFADHKPMLEIPSDERNELGFDSDEIVQRSGDEAVLFKIDDGVMIKAEAAAADHCIQQAQDHDLKGAATLFTLTNCTS